jgi:cyanophycinase-like exopeptidase
VPKTIVLCGGAEFEPESQRLDRAILGLTKISFPTMVVVPAAAAAHAKRTVRSASRYFKELGAEPHSVMVVDEESAEAGDKAVSLENADLIYLTDGSPLDCVTALSGSSVLRTLTRSWERGAVVAACGASAMAMGPYFWDGGAWEPGLGLLPGIVVIPHLQLIAGRISYARLSKDLPRDEAGNAPHILGIDDSTGIFIEAGKPARVVGAGLVTLYTPTEEKEVEAGQRLDIALL